jgi:hypothetical protein
VVVEPSSIAYVLLMACDGVPVTRTRRRDDDVPSVLECDREHVGLGVSRIPSVVPLARREMEVEEAVRRVLEGEERVEVNDRRGGGVIAYYRKADGLLYVCDRQGERPIMTLDRRMMKGSKNPGANRC